MTKFTFDISYYTANMRSLSYDNNGVSLLNLRDIYSLGYLHDSNVA
jgi:hypothetical protein